MPLTHAIARLTELRQLSEGDTIIWRIVFFSCVELRTAHAGPFLCCLVRQCSRIGSFSDDDMDSFPDV